jgi:hypothetical protein
MLYSGCSNKRRIIGKAKYVCSTLSRALVVVCTTWGGKEKVVIILMTLICVCVLSVWLSSVLCSFKLALIPYPF